MRFPYIVVADTRIVQRNVKVYQIKAFGWCLGAIKVAFLFETPLQLTWIQFIFKRD